MVYNWDDIKCFFEPDGSLRDIYVLDTTLSDWETVIDFLNLTYPLKFGDDNDHQIDKEYVLRYFLDKTLEMESKPLRINLNGINIHSYFFCPEQIEFDIDPKEIKSLQDFGTVEKFMLSISKIINKPIILTAENSDDHPWLKIDPKKGTHEINIQN